VCSQSVVKGWGEFRVVDLGFLVYLEPSSPIGLLVGVSLSCVHYPILGFSQLEGLSFVPCPDRSGLSDALDEFTNRYDRVESGSVVHDGVGIALL
jgi:hypothetical protein